MVPKMVFFPKSLSWWEMMTVMGMSQSRASEVETVCRVGKTVHSWDSVQGRLKKIVH